MDINKVSDLAKAVQNKERISAPSAVSKSAPAPAAINGVVIPKGAVPVMEGTRLVCDSADNMPKGSREIRYSREDEG